MSGAGLIWALALLTKIHAWFLLPIVAVGALLKLPWRRALAALLVWAVVAIGAFWAGWPWLWYDTWSRLRNHLGTGITRSTILVQYFGQVIVDRDVPWHYPWFYFAVTVPVGLHILGAIGTARCWHERRADMLPLYLAATIVVFLVIFSTRLPVYDGERLFLLVFPAWACLIGRGFGWLWYRLKGAPRTAVLAWSSPLRSRLWHGGAAPFWAQLLQRARRRTSRRAPTRTGANLLERRSGQHAAGPFGEPSTTGRNGGTRAQPLSRTRNRNNVTLSGPKGHRFAGRGTGGPRRMVGNLQAHRVLATRNRGAHAPGRRPASRPAIPARGLAERNLALSAQKESRRSHDRRKPPGAFAFTSRARRFTIRSPPRCYETNSSLWR